MWPRTLDMTVDECRVMLRKLELDTYAHVISTFRAHGVLDQSKLKILSELRSILQIDPERHRSETRRATNDEELTTIADKLFGDDSILQWTREGKRCAPLLYRSKPYTSITVTADEATEWVRRINHKLPEPSSLRRASNTSDLAPQHPNVILADPMQSSSTKRPMSINQHLFQDVSLHRNLPYVSHKSAYSTTAAAVPSTTTTVPARTLPPPQATSPIQPTKQRRAPVKRDLKKNRINFRQEILPGLLIPPPLPVPIPWTGGIEPVSVTTTKSRDSPRSKRGKSHGTTNRKRMKKVEEEKPNEKYESGIESLIEEVRPPPFDLLPQIATSKKDITTNLKKFNQLSMPVYPAREKGREIHRIGKGKLSADMQALRRPQQGPSPKIQILSQTILPPAAPMINGNILYNQLQKQVVLVKAPPPVHLSNGSRGMRVQDEPQYVLDKSETFIRNDESGKRIAEGPIGGGVGNAGEDKLSLPQQFNGYQGGEEIIESEELLDSLIVEDDQPSTTSTGGSDLGEHGGVIIRTILEEDAENDMEISDDKIIFDLNESGEIIEEECAVEGYSYVQEEYITVDNDEQTVEELTIPEESESPTTNGSLEKPNGTDFEYLLDTVNAGLLRVEEEDVEDGDEERGGRANSPT